jgi:tRNA threonylcarbamoyl adenosine modification protein YeaZ
MASSGEQKEITLSIETAVGGGSISLISAATPIAGTAGGGLVSRAEDLLLRIEDLLKRSDIDRSDLRSIAISTGPGSFTGLRIGLATAMGLSTALGIPCTGVPLFNAIVEGSGSLLVVVVPIGRSDLCFRLFENAAAKGDYSVGGNAEFDSFVRENRPETIAHHPDVDVSQIEAAELGIELTGLGSNMAEHIGRYASAHPGLGSMEPIYVRNPRFA